MKWLMELIVLALVMAAATWFGSWWMVPIVGGAYGVWAAHRRLTLITATLAGALGWGLLLAYDASVGPMDRLLHVTGALFRVPGGALIVLALAYGALLAVTAAALTRGVRRAVSPA